MRLPWVVVIAAMLAGGSNRGVAGAPVQDEKPDIKGPLAGLPSPAGAYLEKIVALGDNQWLNLGAPAADPKWGKGRGRSWGAKMPYAPELRGAFLAGTGVHAFMTPDGRYTDDIFFYDLNAHRWIAVYPGTDSKTFVANIKSGELKLNGDGQLVDKEGQPVPYGNIPGHSYQSHAYDPDRHRYVTTLAPSGRGGDQYTTQMPWGAEAYQLLKQQMKGATSPVDGAPFTFNAYSGKFEREPVKGVKPVSGFGAVLVYLPERKALWHYARQTTLIGDATTRLWADPSAKGPVPPGIDFGACHDSKRDRVYVAGGSYRKEWGKEEGFVYVYNVKTNAWSNPPNRGEPAPTFDTNNACLHYDTANDRVINVVHAGAKRGVYAFDPETAAWGDAPSALPPNIPQHCWSGFYSPEVNAHFFYVAGDSNENGTMWAYRYKQAKK